MVTRLFTGLAFLLAAGLPCQAMLIRADRDDAEYVELASRYPAAIRLAPSAGEGALIAPRWVLTAAHRAQAIKPGQRIEIGGRGYAVQAVDLHPEWRRTADNDIALIFLREAVSGIEPAPIYRAADENGKTVAFAGHGATGRIGALSPKSDNRKRAAINTVDRVGGKLVALRVKSADDASDLQGVAVPEETGAPMFIEAAGDIYVAGILAAIEDANADRIAGVGDWQAYARVSSHAKWIDDTMFRAAQEEARTAGAK